MTKPRKLTRRQRDIIDLVDRGAVIVIGKPSPLVASVIARRPRLVLHIKATLLVRGDAVTFGKQLRLTREGRRHARPF